MEERVLSFAEALQTVIDHAIDWWDTEPPVEQVPLAEAAGRVAGRRVFPDRNLPPFIKSTRDGYAMHSEDSGLTLRVVGSIRAGEEWRGGPLPEGEAVEIMTGAALPHSADCVAMVEHVVVDGGTVRLIEGRTLHTGENLVYPGKEANTAVPIVRRHTLLRAAEISSAASCGYTSLPVRLRPTVAIAATGDELVDVGETPTKWQIRNSNTPGLAALVREQAAIPVELPITPDAMDALRATLVEARKSDLILLSGGVSKGKYDLVEQALAEAGAEFFFTGALIQPGKPVVFGRLPNLYPQAPENKWTYFFGLPGNPVSTQVTFALFVAPMLRALSGRTDVAPVFVEARLREDVKGGAKVTRFLPAELESTWQAVTAHPVKWNGSGDMWGTTRGGGFVVLPAGVERFASGESVRFLQR